jgi:hypothetical protein
MRKSAAAAGNMAGVVDGADELTGNDDDVAA